MLSGRVRCVETNDAVTIGCIQCMTQVVAVVALVTLPCPSSVASWHEGRFHPAPPCASSPAAVKMVMNAVFLGLGATAEHLLTKPYLRVPRWNVSRRSMFVV